MNSFSCSVNWSAVNGEWIAKYTSSEGSYSKIFNVKDSAWAWLFELHMEL